MTNDRKQKLVDLGAEVLADALLDMAVESIEADDVVDRLVSSPQENVQRFRKKLSGLKRRTRYIGWRESHAFARELGMMLQLLQSGVTDPLTGAELVAEFFEADGNIFEMCDDSSGHIGEVFRFDAKNLFVAFASRCADKNRIADLILRITRKDDYGIRDVLMDCAGDCLPEAVIREMIVRIQDLADQAVGDSEKRHHLRAIESLARQIKDAELFERTRIASWGTLNAGAMVDIARVYLESGEFDKARLWLNRVPGEETFVSGERDELLKVLYQKQGDSEKLAGLLTKSFRAHPSAHTLEALLDVIGHAQREDIVAREVERILKSDSFRTSDAEFLIAMERIDEAEAYLLKQAPRFDGAMYSGLPALAEAMESENRWLVSSLIYRSLLTAILERGYTKAYAHGVRYLKKLDLLSNAVSEWNDWGSHECFKENVLQAHRRKTSFWSQYRDINVSAAP